MSDDKKPMLIHEVLPGLGKLNALIKNIMHQTKTEDPDEAIWLVNSGKYVLTKPVRWWREENGIIYFSVTSNGRTGKEWMAHLRKRGFPTKDYYPGLMQALLSPDFKPTSGVTTEVALIKGSLLNGEEDTQTKDFYAAAAKQLFVKSNAELALLIREKCLDEDLADMGIFSVCVAHDPIHYRYDNTDFETLLGVSRNGSGSRVETYPTNPKFWWEKVCSFAFTVSQVQN